MGRPKKEEIKHIPYLTEDENILANKWNNAILPKWIVQVEINGDSKFVEGIVGITNLANSREELLEKVILQVVSEKKLGDGRPYASVEYITVRSVLYLLKTNSIKVYELKEVKL